MKPTIGRIVHYRMLNIPIENDPYAAIITSVSEPEKAESSVSLQVFGLSKVYPVSDVPFGDGPGCWSWPARTESAPPAPVQGRAVRVGLGRVYSTGDYDNIKIYIEDDTGIGETVMEAYRRLQLAIDAQLQRSRPMEYTERISREAELRAMGIREQHIAARLGAVTDRVRNAIRLFDELRALLAHHGVEIDDIHPDHRRFIATDPAEPAALDDDNGDDNDDMSDANRYARDDGSEY